MGYVFEGAAGAAVSPNSSSGAAPGARQRLRTDPRGLVTGTTSGQAVDCVEAALEAMLSYFGDPVQCLEQAVAAAPGWAHPRVLLASLLLTAAEAGPAGQARAQLAQAQPALAGAPPREQAHFAAAQAAAAGDWDRACALWEEILVRWPVDVAALLFAHLFDFYRGDALNLRRRPQRVLPSWSSGMPLRGYVLGIHAFGLEECGHYDEAEEAGRAALEANPRDPWAVHAVAHVFEMRGQCRGGAQWLAQRQADWAVDNGLAFHNWFHVALFQLEEMDTAAALATYDAHLADATAMALQRVDGTAILWRLRLLGVDTGDRFARLHAAWQSQPECGFYAFNDLHAALAAWGAGQDAQAAPVAQELVGASQRRMAQAVGEPLLRAFAHHARGQWQPAAAAMLAVRDQANAFGGSHAQRDLITLSAIDAAVRAGHAALAHHLLNERCPAKARTPLTQHWRARAGQAR